MSPSWTAPVCRCTLALLVALLPGVLLAQPATITVTSLADSGVGTLRAALDQANVDGVPTRIEFDPSLSGGVIVLATQLTGLASGDTTIDGDLDADCEPEIAIDGSALSSGNLLMIGSAGNHVRGLAFYGFQLCGAGGDFWIHGTGATGNLLECNWIGLDVAGSARPGACFGFKVTDGASENQIGPGNRITGSQAGGIFVEDGYNGGYPEFVGLSPDRVEVITPIDLTDGCGFFRRRNGATFYDQGGHPFTEQIGLRLTGTLSIGIDGSYTFSLPGLDDQARLTVDGVVLVDWPGGGTPTPVTVPLAAGAHAVRLDYLEGGGAARLELIINGPGTSTLSTDGNAGGCATGQTGLCGELYQLRVPSERNRITRNAIWANSGAGIRFNCCCGPTPNDPGDLDLGPNTVLNIPVLASVGWAGTPDTYRVTGTAPAGSLVELFIGEGAGDTFGEPKAFLADGSADGGGAFSIDFSPPLGTDIPRLTATATDALGNTSEAAANLEFVNGVDAIAVGAGVHGFPGADIEVPIHVRDLPRSPLGVDRAFGQRIQGLLFKVVYTPAEAVAAIHFERAGITLPLSGFENNTQAGNSASYVAAFDETAYPIPFTLGAAAPGEVVAKLVISIAPGAAPGPVQLTLDAISSLSDQGGYVEETAGLGTLSLASGAFTVDSNAAVGLFATPLSTSTIALSWIDPQLAETGFRVERSSDGFAWETIGTAGPDDVSFLDSGLPPSATRSYRLVTLLGGGDGHASHLATATTFPATAAKVCSSPLSGPRTLANFSAIAWNGVDWGLLWGEQTDGRQSDLLFQRRSVGGLSPLAPPAQITATDMGDGYPTLRWNGSHFAAIRSVGMRGEPGPDAGTGRWFLTLLAADGAIVRADVPLPAAYCGSIATSTEEAFGWDGTHWGWFVSTCSTARFLKIAYYRLDADGDVVLGPVDITPTTDRFDLDQAAAYAPGPGLWGVAWNRYLNGETQIWFQRVEPASGALVGSPVQLGGRVGTSFDGISVAWDPSVPPVGAWMVAWTDYPLTGEETPVLARRVAVDGTVAGTEPVRLSDDPDPDDPRWDEGPLLAVTASGETRAFVWSADNTTGAYELGLLRADASGARSGSRTILTPADGRNMYYPHVASDGTRQAAVMRDQATGWWEIAALEVDEFGSPSPPVALTSGHVGSGASMHPRGIAPLGAGFVALWLDNKSGANQIYGRTVDGSGATVAELSPLTSSTVAAAPAVHGLGDVFAAVWRDLAGNLRFARYDASGGVVTAETTVATGISTPYVLGFDGEEYGLVFRRAGSYRHLRVRGDGTVDGSEHTLFSPATTAIPELLWVGTGWALVWRGSDSVLYFGLFDRDGAVLITPVAITGPPSGSARTQLTAAYGAERIAVAWTDNPGVDPPGNDIYYAIVDRAGTVPNAPAIAASTAFNDSQARLIFAGGTFRLFFTSDVSAWVREQAILPDGSFSGPPRPWTNRGTAVAVTSNGATSALAWSQLGEIYLETGACLDDTTPPACPDLAIASANRRVRLTWTGGDDPETGIWRFDLYRDGRMLNELFPERTAVDDAGFTLGAVHQYELRAMNGALMESESCPVLAFSTVRGDANGNGILEGGDVFYLINFFLAGGPPPRGDADANGSGGVTTADIFFLINYFYAGGPAPTWSGATRRIEAHDVAATEPLAPLAPIPPIAEGLAAADRRRPASRLAFGNAERPADSLVVLPILLFDAAGTPLGSERTADDALQALAVQVRVLPAAAVTRVEIRRSGRLAERTPIFESTPTRSDGAGLVVVFDESATPIDWSNSGTASRDRGVEVAELLVTLREGAAEIAGGRLELRFDPATTLLSNQAGTLTETSANGWLRLSDGGVEVAP